MKSILIFVLISCSTQCLAQTAKKGSYIVIRGAVEDCVFWSWRILDVAQVEGDEPVSLLNIPNMSVVDLDRRQIKSNLLYAIQNLTGSEPNSIKVEILETEQKYNSIVREYVESLRHLSHGTCPFKSQNIKRNPAQPGIERLEKNIEKIRHQEIVRSIV